MPKVWFVYVTDVPSRLIQLAAVDALGWILLCRLLRRRPLELSYHQLFARSVRRIGQHQWRHSSVRLRAARIDVEAGIGEASARAARSVASTRKARECTVANGDGSEAGYIHKRTHAEGAGISAGGNASRLTCSSVAAGEKVGRCKTSAEVRTGKNCGRPRKIAILCPSG